MAATPLKIDVHTHILPENLPDLKARYGQGPWVRLDVLPCGKRGLMRRSDGSVFREVEDSTWSIPRRLRDCDALGVDVHVMSTVPVMFSYWADPEAAADLSRELNDHMAATVATSPERLVGLGTLPMQSPELAVGELRRCMRMGLAGVQIGSNVRSSWGGRRAQRDQALCDKDFLPVFRAAAELGAAVFVHPWDMMGEELMGRYFMPWLVGMPAETCQAMCSLMFGGVLEALPELNVCFAHGGGSFPSTLGRIQHGWDVRPDLCAVDTGWSPREHLRRGRLWVDSLVHEPSALADLVRGDQDARHEVEALRKFLAGEEGSSQSPLPAVAAQMRARIDTLEAQRRTLQGAIQAGFPDYDRLVHPAPPTLADVRGALAADEALLMLLPTEDAVYVWAVTRDGANGAARVVWPKAQLAQLVQGLRQTLDFAAMGNRVPPFNAAAASTLYQRLLAPVQASFAGKTHLVVAAGGVLGQIPFGVLRTQPGPARNADAPWLIQQAAITHVPSLSAWLAVKQFAKARSASEALVAWGDPRFGGAVAASDAAAVATRHVVLTRATTQVDLEKEDPHSALRYGDIPALPETRDELLAIAAALHADSARDLHLGADASKASVLASSQSGELRRKKVVAFATHGLMAGDLPQLTQPALALASTGREAQEPLGALLTLDEVLNLKLNADWVILSACNTAAADGRADEALGGLARGFFYAGSRSLLVTHWAVESGSAMQLTTRTMAHYSSHPEARKADSLRQAMLEVMQQPAYAHPAFWAPYALVGDGGR